MDVCLWSCVFRVSEGVGGEVGEEGFVEREGYRGVEEMRAAVYVDDDGFRSELRNSASKFWAERTNVCQDVQYESLESLCYLKHFASRSESPWKLEGEASGVSSKLKLLEQELLNLERIGKSDLSKVSSKMRKQTRRYQALAGKIDNLCRRMFQTFSQRVEEIEIDVFRSLHPLKSEPSEGSSFFRDCLVEWRILISEESALI